MYPMIALSIGRAGLGSPGATKHPTEHDVLLLLLLTFHPAGQDETIIFDSNQQIGWGRKRALHLVAEAGAEEWKDGGPAPLVSVLTLAGTDVNATDGVSVWRGRGERVCV